MIRFFRVAGVAGAVLALFACSDPDPGSGVLARDVTFDTINGVVHLQNGGEGAWPEGEQWTAEIEWRVGELDGGWGRTFGGGPHNVRIGPDGRIYYIALGDRSVRVFDAEGVFVQSIGGRTAGQGPGELNSPMSLAWDSAGRLWVPDFSNDRYSIFDAEGELVDDFRRPIAGAPNLFQIGHVDADGHFVDEAPVSRTRDEDRAGIAFVRISANGAVVDTLPPIYRPVYVTADIANLPFGVIPPGALQDLRFFRPRLLYDIGPDDTVWFTKGDRVRLIQRTLAGDTLRIVEADHRAAGLTPEDEGLIEEVFRGVDVDRSQFKLARQIVQGLHVMDDGHVLVQIEEEPGVDSSIFDIFDPDGRFLGTVDFTVPVRYRSRGGSRGDTLVMPTESPEGVPQLVRLVLARD